MRKERLNGKDFGIMGMLWGITFVFGLLMALRLNIPPVLDEVGVLANSAYAVGDDWSECTYTMGGYYYKYGLSILYAPFMLLIENPFVLYKVLLSFNMAVYSFSTVIAYVILKKHLGIEVRAAAPVALACGLLPSCMLYELYAKADVLMIFLPWTAALILLELTGLETEKKLKRAVLSGLLSFCSVYAFATHTRGIVVILAVLFSLILLKAIARLTIVNAPVYFGTSAFFLLIDKLVSGVFYDGVYGIYGTQHASAESFDFQYLKKIFSGHGISSFFKLVFGWLFEGMTATYGLLGIGILGGIVLLVIYLKKRRTEERISDEAAVFSLFSVMNFLGAFGMGLIFFFPVTDKYYLGEMVVRSDRLVYERYMVAAFGPLLLLALYLLCFRRDVIKKWVPVVCVGGYAAVSAVFFLKCAGYLEGVVGAARYFISLCVFLKVDGGTTYAAFDDISGAFFKSFLLGFAIFIILLLVIYLLKKDKLGTIVFSLVFIAASVVITIICYDRIRLSRDGVLCEWTEEPADIILQLAGEADDYPILWDGSAKDIKHYQFIAKSFVVGSYCTGTVQADNCFIISRKNRYIKDYYEDDYYLFESFDYKNATRDIIYVKGEELRSKLEGLGWKLKKYKGKLKPATLPDEPQALIIR